jgi:hypothetical protein
MTAVDAAVVVTAEIAADPAGRWYDERVAAVVDRAASRDFCADKNVLLDFKDPSALKLF